MHGVILRLEELEQNSYAAMSIYMEAAAET